MANQEITSVKRVLQTISNCIADSYANIDGDELFDQLLARERLGSTYVGEGVALPHCRLEHCTQPIGSLMQLKQPILFDMDSQSSTDLIFALVVPTEFQQAHLDILSMLTTAFQKPEYRAALRAARDTQSLYEAALAIE